jgi:hypothetical protein
MSVGPEIVERPAEVLDEGMSGNDDPRGAVLLQPTHRSEACLQTTVVGLEPVVGMKIRAVEGRGERLVEHIRKDPVPIRGDLDG